MLYKPVVCLMGPTASGKSHLAIQVGQYYPVEIVSVDSVLVYRKLNIGSAKPTMQERKGVIHHMIDCCDPYEAFSVERFCQQALSIIQGIHQRQHLPLLVGGTALYFKALLEGLSPLPSAQPEVRKALEDLAQREGAAALHRQLQVQDPKKAAVLHPNDRQRLIRALEIIYITGSPIRYLPRRSNPFTHLHVYAITPSCKVALHQLIQTRLDQMLAAGFQAEVETLMDTPEFSLTLPAFRSVGYRQMCMHVLGVLTDSEMYHAVCTATRQLAKRQMTWFRHWPGLTWLGQTPLDAQTELLRACRQWMYPRSMG